MPLDGRQGLRGVVEIGGDIALSQHVGSHAADARTARRVVKERSITDIVMGMHHDRTPGGSGTVSYTHLASPLACRFGDAP